MAAPMRMNTGIPHMPTDPKLLTLVQWLSPAYPLGAFAYSHGLETAIAERWIADAGDLKAWLHALLEQGSGRSEAIWLGCGFRAADDTELTLLDAHAQAFAASAERIAEAARQGSAFCRTTNAVWELALPDVILPLAVGRAARLVGLDQQETCMIYLHAFVSNLVSAAVRLVPLGQTDGQSTIAALATDCSRIAAETAELGFEDVFSNTFFSDIAAMQHETIEPRLFQS